MTDLLAKSDKLDIDRRKEAIYQLLLTDDVDLIALKAISRGRGGFLCNELRSRVWPKLLGINRFKIPDYSMSVVAHRDDAQVKLDIERSLWCHEHTENWSEPLRTRRRKALREIIMAVLCRNAELHYYQGYHDVVSVFLLVFEDDYLAFAMTEVVSNRYLMDFLAKDFEILCRSMRMIITIINVADTAVGNHLSNASVEPFFATSWLITWFAHDVKKINDIARMYDAMLCSHPLFVFYLCAAMVISIRELILDCECEFSSLFDLMVHAPLKIGIPCEVLIEQADKLMALIPPSKLKGSVDKEVKRLIDRDMIQAFHVPSHLGSRYVPADWVLLQQLYLSPRLDASAHMLYNKKFHPMGCTNLGEEKWLIYIAKSMKIARRSKILKRYFKKESSEKYLSYVGPFKGKIDDESENDAVLAKALSRWETLVKCVASAVHKIDEGSHSLRTLLIATTVLGVLSGSLYFYDNSHASRSVCFDGT